MPILPPFDLLVTVTPSNAVIPITLIKGSLFSSRSYKRWCKLFKSQQTCLKRFNSGGIDALRENHRTGRRSSLSCEQLKQLTHYIEENSIKPSGARLNATMLITYIEKEFSVRYRISNIYRLLHLLHFSWSTSRSMHPKQSLEAQDDFKKIPN